MKKGVVLVILLLFLIGCNSETKADGNQFPKAIYNKTGVHVGWIYFDEFIYNINATQYVATIQKDLTFSLNGEFVGFFEDGYFRDRNCYAVTFIEGAKKGPILPTFTLPPLPILLPKSQRLPLKPLQPKTPYINNWPNKGWSEYIMG